LDSNLLPRAISAAVIPISIGFLSWLIGRAKPANESPRQGTIQPEKISAGITVIVGSFMALLGIAVTLFGQASWAGLILALVGISIAGFMAPSLTSVHQVHWTDEGIDGPSKMLGPTLGTARTTIDWSDIVRTGVTATSYWYVEAHDGRRVYWSYLYKGYRALTATLRQKCPDLELPHNMG
jgi:hypothetical protein